jgi:hypothetical protein
LYIIEVLRARDIGANTKLKLIYTGDIITSYLFLFILRVLILLVIIYWNTIWLKLIPLTYVLVNFLNADGVLRKHENWEQTLYELKKKYYVNREN